MTPEGPPNPAPTKRKRLQGACDNCRRKKARCDSSVMPDKRCSNCIALASECTHLYANQKHAQILNRTPLKTAVEGANSGTLGQYRDKMNGLLQAVLSSTYQAPSHPAILRDTLVSLARYSRALEEVLPIDVWSSIPVPAKYEPPPPIAGASAGSIGGSTHGDYADSESESDQDEGALESPQMDQAKSPFLLRSDQTRYYGLSSTTSIVATALEFCNEHHRNPHATELVVEKYKRPQFWNSHSWELPLTQTKQPLSFPEKDLLDHLIHLYFAHVNLFLPIFHKPTFDWAVNRHLHVSNADFGTCLLAVCALASRYSDDRRVVDPSTTSELGCGHHWFRQVEASFSFSKVPSIYTIQAYYIAALYTWTTSNSDQSWYYMGLAIRAAQDLGMHRSTTTHKTQTVQGELRNRLWWALSTGEMLLSSTTGRPCSIQPADCRVDLPIDCGDNQWESEHPGLRFNNYPSTTPTHVEYFCVTIPLFNILGSVQRSLYAARPQGKEGPQSPTERALTLNDVDVALDAWRESVPSNLQLTDPEGFVGKPAFRYQMASLWMMYYYIRMTAHRPFIAGKYKRPSSLEICVRAARACSRLTVRGGSIDAFPIMPVILMTTMSMAAMFLLIDIWRSDLTGQALETGEELKDVHRCIILMKKHESRNGALGRRVDLLLALLAASKLPLPPDCGNLSQRSPMGTPDIRHRPPPLPQAASSPSTPSSASLPSSSSATEPHRPKTKHPSGTLNSYPPTPNSSSPAQVAYPTRDNNPQEHNQGLKENWLDLLTDPDSLRAPGPPTVYRRPLPHERRVSGGSSSGSHAANRLPHDDRRQERFHPFYPPPPQRGPSNLRHVHVYQHETPGMPMDVDERVERNYSHRGRPPYPHGHSHPQSVQVGGQSLPAVLPPAKRGALTRIEMAAQAALPQQQQIQSQPPPPPKAPPSSSNTPIPSFESAPPPPPPPPPKSKNPETNGHWRNPYVFDVAPS